MRIECSDRSPAFAVLPADDVNNILITVLLHVKNHIIASACLQIFFQLADITHSISANFISESVTFTHALDGFAVFRFDKTQKKRNVRFDECFEEISELSVLSSDKRQGSQEIQSDINDDAQQTIVVIEVLPEKHKDCLVEDIDE